MRTLIRFSIIVLFLVLGLQAVTAQTSPTRLRLKQLELAPDTLNRYVIIADTSTRVAEWGKLDSLGLGGGSSSFIVDADTGTPQTIATGDTLQINSGWGANTTVGATGVVTVTGDSTQVATQFDISALHSGPLTAGRIPRATGTYTLSDGVLRDDGSLLAIGGATVSGYSFYDYSTGGWRMPTGTTAQRPTNAAGVKRYNSSLGYSETANGSVWLQSDFPAGVTRQTITHNGTSWRANSYILSDGAYNQFGGTSWNVKGSNTFYRKTQSTLGAAIVAFDEVIVDGYSVINSNGTGLVANGGTTTVSGNSYPAIIGVGQNASYAIRWHNNIGVLGVTGQSAAGNAADYIGVSGQAILRRTVAVSTNGPHIGVHGLAGSTQSNLGTTGIFYGVVGLSQNYGGIVNSVGYGVYGASYLSATNWGFYTPIGGGNNAFGGNTIVGAVTTPAQTLHVAGTLRLTGSDGTATALMGRDADGDISAVAHAAGLTLAGGTLDVNRDSFPTFDDLAGLGGNTLYTGDGTIETDRTVTIDDNYALIISGSPGVLSFTETSGYIGSLSSYGFYKEIADTAYYITQATIKQPGGAGSTLFQVVAGRQDASTMATAEVNGDGGASLSSLNVSGESSLLLNGGSATYAADVSHITKIGATTIHTTTSTGIGINDTSPEKSLDVGGMGKFRQLSGQDNSVTIGTNANMGTGRSASITDAQSSDVAGRFSFTSGTTLTAGEWVTLTWATSFDHAPAVVLMPENANAASLVPYLYVVPSTTGCSIVVNVTGAPYEGLTFEFNYIVIQGK